MNNILVRDENHQEIQASLQKAKPLIALLKTKK